MSIRILRRTGLFFQVVLALALNLAASPLRAQDIRAQDTCAPVDPPPPLLCSVSGLIEAVNPPLTLDVFGNISPNAFARDANTDLMPGQASMSLSGGISAGGAACARHLAAKRIGGTDGVPGLDQGTVEFIENMSGEDINVPQASGGTRRAVFEIFSPNLVSYQSGGLGHPLSYRHAGVGGWQRNSAAHLTIILTDAGPGDLRAGQSYKARAVGADLFTAWTGQIRPRPYPPPNDEQQRREQELEKRTCHALRQAFLKTLDQSAVRLDATVGRHVRDMDCDMDGVGQAGTRTRAIGGTLSGTVNIERITETKVIGRFDLSGTGRIKRERRTWNYSLGPGRVDINSDEGDKSLRVTGRFAAPNMRNMGFSIPPFEIAKAPVTADKPPLDELRLITFWPQQSEQNVPHFDPGIRLKFDRPLDPASIQSSAIKIETGINGTGGKTIMEEIALQVRMTGADTISVTPDPSSFFDGVQYRVNVKGGPDGVRGAEGEWLLADSSWTFETMVDLRSRSAAMQKHIPDYLRLKEGIESKTVQVVTDAPLVRRKPTAIRVFSKWKPLPNIATAWQVSSFPAKIRARDKNTGLLLGNQTEDTIHRPDQFTDRQRRNGANSINLMGWTPKYKEATQIQVEVEPIRLCDKSPVIFTATENLVWDDFEKDLNIGYTFAHIGPWVDQVPKDLQTYVAMSMRSANEFLSAITPFQNVSISKAPDIRKPLDDFQRLLDQGETVSNVQKQVLYGHQKSYETKTEYSHYDLVLTLYPYDMLPLAGASLGEIGKRHLGTGFAALHPKYVTPDQAAWNTRYVQKRSLKTASTMIHETLHALGLDHIPDDLGEIESEMPNLLSQIIPDSLQAYLSHGVLYDEVKKQETCRDFENKYLTTKQSGHWETIEGIQIFPNDIMRNKSAEDGNSDHELRLLPIMWPCTTPLSEAHITPRNYNKLLNSDFSTLKTQE